MKIAIIGSRNFKNLEKIGERLGELQVVYGVLGFTVISGGALGVDQEVEELCKANNIQIETIHPVHPSIKAHYLYRNIEILTKADKIIAFWDGVSRGTKFTIDYAKARGKSVEVIRE